MRDLAKEIMLLIPIKIMHILDLQIDKQNKNIIYLHLSYYS